MDYTELVDKAFEAQQLSYSPYSNFKVGAALLSDDGDVTLGANIENSAYGVTICAERTAVFSAVLKKKKKFIAIAVACGTEEFAPPCGSCLQVMMEMCGPDLDVILTNNKKEQEIHKMSELLPHSFGDNFLK